jgi:hypothetical protein
MGKELFSERGLVGGGIGAATRFDFDFRVKNVIPTARGAMVWLRFVSLQDSSQGAEQESCTQWSLDYELIWTAAGDLLIDGARGHNGDGHTPCP